jgi:ABC-2 type transport system permease protein
MKGPILLIVVVVLVAIRVYFRFFRKKAGDKAKSRKLLTTKDRPRTSWQRQFLTVLVMTKLSTKRFFRDRLAQFFTVLFPLIFLFVFGSLNKGGNVSFHVAIINQSTTAVSRTFTHNFDTNKTFKVDSSTTLSAAEDKMSKGQIDGIIVFPPGFGSQAKGSTYPSGQVQVLYNQSTTGTGATLVALLQGMIKQINAHYVPAAQPFTATGKQLNVKSLSAFDYTFSGLLGFSIIGLGIFGPVNVFPELKKQGVLRRLNTTPLRVWQYFVATMLSQAITGIISIAIQFGVAIEVFNLKVDGDYPEIIIFTMLGIFMILGLGLAIGGWAKNERQAAPLSNIVVFPMLFLSGTFFPRYLMPEWLQSITNYLPLTPVIDGLRQLTTEGKHLTDLGPQLGVMAVWFVVIYVIAFRVFRWE